MSKTTKRFDAVGNLIIGVAGIYLAIQVLIGLAQKTPGMIMCTLMLMIMVVCAVGGVIYLLRFFHYLFDKHEDS
jgi:uncharacterized membrane protein YkgB